MCDNKVMISYIRSNGRYSTYYVRCGQTDPWGGRAVCDTCLDDPDKMREIEAHERMIAEDNAASHSAGWGDW